MKNISQYIPLHLSIFLTIGVLIGYYVYIPTGYLVVSISIILILLLVFYTLSRKFTTYNLLSQIFSYISILLIGIASISFQDKLRQDTHYSHFISETNSLLIQIEKRLKPTVYQHKYYAQIIQIDSIICTGKIVVNLSKDSLNGTLEVGEIYHTKSNFQAINSPLNPYSFNYKNYLQKQGIYHQIAIKSVEIIGLPIQNTTLKTLAAQWREKIQTSLQKHPFEENEMAIINAIILGQRQRISKNLLNSYAGAGAIHILAVSGLHVGILFLLLNFLFKPLEKLSKGNHIKTSLIILILWGFALLTGLSGSVVRAVTMFTFIAIGLAFKNERSAVLHALITSYFILVLIHPLFIFDVGFQMSYTAVLGIVLLQPKIESVLPRIGLYFPRKIWQLLSVSLAATIGTLPISLYYFHQFPGLFFLSNVVIIPFIGIIMMIGLLVVSLSILELLPNFLVEIYGYILHAMNSFIEWVASHETFLFRDISFSIFALMASYFFIIMGYRWWMKRKTPQLLTFFIAIVLLQIVFIYEKYHTENSNEIVIFHKTKESIVGVKEGSSLQLLYSIDSINRNKTRFINTYQVGSKTTRNKSTNTIPNLFNYKNKKIVVVDSLGIFQNISFRPDIVLLRQSPKLNLERLIQEYQPKTVLVDGSNYKSYIKQWKETCKRNKISFHYTGIDGAFVMK